MHKLKTQIMPSTDKYTRKITPILSPSSRSPTAKNHKDNSTSPPRNYHLNNKPKTRERPVLEQKSAMARKGSPLSMLSSSQLNPRKSVLERSIILHNEDESITDDSKKLNRYMFYEDDFSLSKYFLDTSSNCEDHEKITVDQNIEKRDNSCAEERSTPEFTTPKGNRHATRAQNIKDKISKLAIPSQTDSQFKPKPLNAGGAISDRTGQSKSPKKVWTSPKKTQNQNYKLDASYKTSPKAVPISSCTQIKTDTSYGCQKPGEISEREGNKSKRSPLVEPRSPTYGKFSILFRDLGDKKKILDPQRYQKVARTGERDAYGMQVLKENPKSIKNTSSNPYVKNYLESKRRSDAFNLRE